MAFFSSDDLLINDKMRSLIGPDQVDRQIRQAIQFAWIMLPDEKKSVAEVERVIRQTVDRAIMNFREDADAFGRV
jgi:hypothetical protein